jgi:ferredoxin
MTRLTKTNAVEKLFLTFPTRLVREPIIYTLIKEHDLLVNIMSASISPDEHGHMVVELKGDKKHIRDARSYLLKLGVVLQPVTREARWLEKRCTHCIACGLCVPVCSYGAMEIKK